VKAKRAEPDDLVLLSAHFRNAPAAKAAAAVAGDFYVRRYHEKPELRNCKAGRWGRREAGLELYPV
jgi:hypothetical protein